MSEKTFDFEYEPGKKSECRFAEFGVDQNPVMILIHGYGAMWQHWSRNIPAFSETHKIYALDLLGFGESEKPDARYGLKLWSKQLFSFIEQFGIEKCILIGHSMGGASSLWFANEHREKINALVLVDPSGIFPEEISPFEKILYRAVGSPIVGETMFGLFANEFGARQSLLPTYLNQLEVTEELVSQFAKPLKSPGAINSYLAPSRHPDRFLLSDFPRPCAFDGKALLVWGKFDTAFPPSKVATKFEEILPQAKTVILPNTRHCPHHEVSQSFNQTLKEFLR